MNSVNLIGYLGKDFEVAYTGENKCYARNSLAISKKFKNSKGNEETQTSWIPIAIFGKTAETAYLHFPKGSLFACSGELVSSTYTDKDGNNRSSLSVIVHKFYWVNSSKDNKNISQNKENPTQSTQEDKINLDFIDIESENMPF
ncbi:single-stranded DNA-binding protein [uncultured Campylobacter sp.]|uniref:single-stranded DNA-binding protein n=1 Tax=uncultured Campylobacter sp. TaxID=218934 RepID=UPI002617FD6A|nr:single-stranded DNA-binding protein [uncultured Campylobacter sp.]